MEATLQNTSLRQAAVLMRSLDAAAAASLLACLSNEEAQAVRAAMRELEEVTDEERQGVADALAGKASLAKQTPSSATADYAQSTSSDYAGVELQLGSSASSPETYSIAPSVTAPIAMASELTSLSADATPSPLSTMSMLDSLSEVDVATLVAYVKDEQPQTVAVVLSLIAPTKAAEVLAGLSPSLQDAAIGRLAFLNDADSASIEVIEADLKQWITVRREEARRQEDRMTSVRAILHAANDENRTRLIAGLETRGVSWASALAAASKASAEELAGTKSSPEPLPESLAELIRRVDQENAETSEQDTTETISPNRIAPKNELSLHKPFVEELPEPKPEPESSKLSPTAESPKPTLAFDALEFLSIGSLAYVIKHADPQDFVVAMMGASPSMLRRVESLATRKQVKTLRKQIKEVGPMRIDQIELAQSELARLAEVLIRKGQIQVSTRAA